LLREWICRPSCRKTIITERQEAVQELVDRMDVMQSARAILSTLPDLERLLSKQVENLSETNSASGYQKYRYIHIYISFVSTGYTLREMLLE